MFNVSSLACTQPVPVTKSDMHAVAMELAAVTRQHHLPVQMRMPVSVQQHVHDTGYMPCMTTLRQHPVVIASPLSAHLTADA